MSSRRIASTTTTGLSIPEGLQFDNVVLRDKTDNIPVNDELFLTMPNVGNTYFLSSAIHLAALLFGYSKIPLLDSTHDCYLHVDVDHMTRIRDRYAGLDSTYRTNQPYDAARALEMILQPCSSRSEYTCNIHSECPCHAPIPC